jgi:hypothetical protein
VSIDHERIRKALPLDLGVGRRSLIRQRPDVVEIVLDCVLRRRQFLEIAARCGVDVESVNRFRRKFITPEVEKIVLVEAQKLDAKHLDAAVNEGQDKVEGGILGVLAEQKRLYRLLHDRLSDGRDVEDLLPGLTQLLRDQTKTYEALLRTYSNLRDKTTVVLPLSEHPEVAKLMDALWVVFKLHPEAFAAFKEIAAQKRLPLDVE